MAANRKRLGKLLNNLHLIPAPGPPPLDPVLLYEDRATDPLTRLSRSTAISMHLASFSPSIFKGLATISIFPFLVE